MIAQFLFILGQAGQRGGSTFFAWLPIILIILIVYLLMIRPQAKKQRLHREMLDSLKKGDKIVTAGGIYGTIVGIKAKDNTLVVKVADNVKLEISRNSVSKKLE